MNTSDLLFKLLVYSIILIVGTERLTYFVQLFKKLHIYYHYTIKTDTTKISPRVCTLLMVQKR